MESHPEPNCRLLGGKGTPYLPCCPCCPFPGLLAGTVSLPPHHSCSWSMNTPTIGTSLILNYYPREQYDQIKCKHLGLDVNTEGQNFKQHCVTRKSREQLQNGNLMFGTKCSHGVSKFRINTVSIKEGLDRQVWDVMIFHSEAACG
jgi:hypothetical protein